MDVLIAFLVTVLTGPVAGTAPLDTTLCSIVATPDVFDGKLVRFRAGVLTDWQHGTVLVHSGCKRGIELSSTEAVPADQAQALDEAVGTPIDGGPERTAMATFTGRFSVHRKQQQYAFDDPFQFYADSIEFIQIYRRTLPR